ncbi:Era Like 12S Mitochondrial RRNA Chaperone 1 [Podila humilis]|nr:Era Like 12S Mitochondrial RRNA Chaperone 1 [Podila humilis]
MKCSASSLIRATCPRTWSSLGVPVPSCTAITSSASATRPRFYSSKQSPIPRLHRHQQPISSAATIATTTTTKAADTPPQPSLEQLKRTLEEKRRQLQEISPRNSSSNTNRTPITAAAALETLQQQQQQQQQQQPNRSIPIFASPADMSVRLPKVIRDFPQPDNPEVAHIALIGSPNAGKSTLVNDLVQSNVSIVSVRPHTTRGRIRAVLTSSPKQIIFYDTPGVVPEKNISRLNRELVTASWKAIEDAPDHLLVVMDCHKLLKHRLVTEDYIFKRLQELQINIPATLIFNKMDMVSGNEARIQEFAEEYYRQYPYFIKTIYTTAKPYPKPVGIQELRSHLLTLAKPGRGPWIYPASQKSDQSDLARVEDLIRSELYGLLKLPYNIVQKNVGWTELEDNVLRIDQNLMVDRPGMKKIIVGTNGAVIRDLTLKARQLIGSALQRRVMLNLQVKVKPKSKHSST